MDHQKENTVIATTKTQRELMAHAIDAERRIKNKLKRRNRQDDDEFRNYFCAEIGSDDDATVAELCKLGLMRKGPTINSGRDYYAYVTEAGIKEVMP